jgi:hypothetical protein
MVAAGPADCNKTCWRFGQGSRIAYVVPRRQARIVRAKIEPTRDYFTKLRRRMQQRGFTSDDELMVLVIAAEQALHTLCNDLQVRVWDGPKEPPPEPTPLGKSKRALEIEERRRRSH